MANPARVPLVIQGAPLQFITVGEGKYNLGKAML